MMLCFAVVGEHVSTLHNGSGLLYYAVVGEHVSTLHNIVQQHTDWVNDVVLSCGGRTCKYFT